jgi:hypothetical protein
LFDERDSDLLDFFLVDRPIVVLTKRETIANFIFVNPNLREANGGICDRFLDVDRS